MRDQVRRHGSPDEGQHLGANTHGSNFRFSFTSNSKDLILGTVIALAIFTIWTVSGKYNETAMKLHDAEKDLQTQVWLRSDTLSKENAELRAQIMSTRELVQAYGIGQMVKSGETKK
jgi:hypothetical protein